MAENDRDFSEESEWDVNVSDDGIEEEDDLEDYNDIYDSDISLEQRVLPPQEVLEGFEAVEPGDIDDSVGNEYISHPFEGDAVGIRPEIPYFESPVDAYLHHVDEKLVGFIVACTNAKAEHFLRESYINNPLGPGKSWRNVKVNGLLWKEVDIPTMYIYFAIHMLMGITQLPRTSMYWQTDPCVQGPPVISPDYTMSRARFLNITKFLRFGTIQEANNNKGLGRLEHFLGLCRETAQKHIYLGEHISIDESLILYKGRLYFRQFNP